MKTIISTAACDVLAAAPKAIPSANHVIQVRKQDLSGDFVTTVLIGCN